MTSPEVTSEIPTVLQRRYPNLPSDYYVPKDPWFLRTRLLKEGVLAPGPSNSSHSSRSDLAEFRRRVSLMGGVVHSDDKSSTPGGSTGTPVTYPAGTARSSLQSHPALLSYGVWVFMDIQLYQLEADNYMVDFKCDGYQNVIRVENDSGTVEWRPASKRIRNKEKEVTSPYPFLDVASDLVAQLAAVS